MFCVGSEPNRQGELAEKSPIGPLGNFEVGKTRDYVVLLDAGTGDPLVRTGRRDGRGTAAAAAFGILLLQSLCFKLKSLDSL